MKIKYSKLTFLLFSIMHLAFFYYMFFQTDSIAFQTVKLLILIYSYGGIILAVIILRNWYKLTRQILSLYTIFMLFFFLFNYGQCFLWAFGIHLPNEIGTVSLYYRLGLPSEYDIFKTQQIILISANMIHLGVITFWTEKSKKVNDIKKNNVNKKMIYNFSKFLLPIVLFSELYFLSVKFINAQKFGYTALYYDSNVSDVNVIFQILSRLFFPVLLGLLFGSNYSRRSRIIVYFLLIIDIVLSLAIGDRGGWIYALLVFLYCHHRFYKRVRIKQFLLGSVAAYSGLLVTTSIVFIRNRGVSISALLETISVSGNNPLVSSIFEMGKSMGITIALIMRGWEIFPYGNTFLYGIAIAPSKDIIQLLKLDYMSLGSWFSQSYLNISNGAGFSLVGEVLLNYGPYYLPFIMIIVGSIVKIITSIEHLSIENDMQIILFKIITTIICINISRNVFSYVAGEFIYTTIQFYVFYMIYRLIFGRKYIKNEVATNGEYKEKISPHYT